MIKRFYSVVIFCSLLGGLYLFTCCKPRVHKDKTDVFLQVNLSNTLGLNWIYLRELNVRDLKTIDSFDVRKTGRHTFRFTPDGPGLYIIQSRQYNFITLLLEPGENAELFADGKKMKKEYRIKGSPGSLLLQEYFYHTERNLKKIDSLRDIFSRARYESDYARKKNELDSAYYKVYMDQRNFVISRAKSNSKSIASLFLINQRFGPELIVQEKTDFPLFAEIDSVLMTLYPNNKHVVDHHQRVMKVKREEAERKIAEERLNSGKPAPDFKLSDQDDKTFAISNLKGKSLLLYFWTATIGKARQDHMLMKSFYLAHKKQGLEIVSVSLDENKELWKSALKIDKLPWITLSEPAGLKSPVAQLFALHEPLPFYFVIDKAGNIAGKGADFNEVEKLVIKTLSR